MGTMRWWGPLLVAVACGNSTTPTTTAPIARFNLSGDTPPNIMEVPFPTDAYRVNGAIIEPIPGVDAIVTRNAAMFTHELAKMDGFGRSELALFYVDDPTQPVDENGQLVSAAINLASLPVNEDACVSDASSVFLIDLATSARVRCRSKFHDDSATSGAHALLGVGPGLGVVLEEGHSYAAVLTSRLTDMSGAHVVASPAFQALLTGTRTGSIATMYGSAIDTVSAALKSALASDQASIVAIAPFTTNTQTHDLFQMRESLEALPVPTLAWDSASLAPMGAVKFAAPVGNALPAGFTASLDDWLGIAPQASGSDDPDFLKTHVLPHDHIAAIGTAVFQAPNFLVLQAGGYTTLDDQTFTRDAQHDIIPNPAAPTAPIWVSFAIPAGAMPANGYPCVVVAHGNPGSRAEAFMELANVLTSQGFIVAGIDLVTDGARSLDAKYRIDAHTDWESSPGAKYVGPDGLADNVDQTAPPVSGRDSGLNFLGQGVNLGAVRDQQRQAIIDGSTLIRVLASNPDLGALQTGTTAPKIDPTKIAYYGGSQGAIDGAVTAAIEPLVTTWALDVVGGDTFTNCNGAAATENTVVQALVLGFGVTNQYVDPASLVGTLAQTIVEPADPLSFASYLVTSPGSIQGNKLTPRNVLQIEALYDETISNNGSEALARAGGWGLAMPNVGPNSNIETLAEVLDPSKVPDPIPLANIAPDTNQLIHDTPMAGVTSVLVQVTGQHYRNVLQSSDTRAYAVPFNRSTKALATPYAVAQSYTVQQAMIARFFADGFQGVPNVSGFLPPVRDVDEDGNPDATDPDPNDPTVK